MNSLIEAEEALRRAMLESDVAGLDRLLDDTFVFTQTDGRVITKEQDLAPHRAGLLRITKVDTSERHEARHGDTAVVTGKMIGGFAFQGQAMESSLRYTQVWRQQSGAWKLVAQHFSELPRP